MVNVRTKYRHFTTVEDLIMAEKQPVSMESDDETPAAPDGGFGWVIVFCGFFTYFFIALPWCAFPVLYAEFVFYFGASVQTVGWIVSLYCAVFTIASIMSGTLIARFGTRLIAILGTVTFALGYALCALAPTITYVFVFFGIISGIGIGLCFMPPIVLCQEYFDKRRPIAIGLVTIAYGVGSFYIPRFMRFLIDIYGWRGAMLIGSGIVLQSLIFQAFFRPLPAKYRSKKQVSDSSNSIKISTIIDWSMFTNYRFMVYSFSIMLGSIGAVINTQHIVNFAIFSGLTPQKGAWVATAVAIGITIFQLLGSFFANLSWVNRLLQMAVLGVICGIILCFQILTAGQFGSMVAIGFIYGSAYGAFICIQFTVLVDLLGKDNVAKVTGLFNFFFGMSGVIAPPLAGWLYDITHSYLTPFLVAGVCQILSGFILFFLNWFKDRDNSCNRRLTDQTYKVLSQRSQDNTTNGRAPTETIQMVAAL